MVVVVVARGKHGNIQELWHRARGVCSGIGLVVWENGMDGSQIVGR
jgi:hypothetical protein